MSKLSRFLISVIITGLAFIAGMHMYHAYEQTVSDQRAQEEELGQSITQGTSLSAPSLQLPVFRGGSAETLLKEIYLQDTPLPADLNKEQARQTLRSILDDYRENPQLQDFYEDLRRNTGESLTLSDLSGENMKDLLIKHPQIQEIIARHSKDPQFVKTLQEIFSNPQFIHSVAVLQQNKDK